MLLNVFYGCFFFVRNVRHFTCTKSATSLCNWNLLQYHLKSVPALCFVTVAFQMGCYK